MNSIMELFKSGLDSAAVLSYYTDEPVVDEDTGLSAVRGLTMTPDAAFKAEDDGEGGRFISGFFTTPDKDRIGDVVLPSALKATMKTFMRKNPIVFFNHQWGTPIGKVVEFAIDEKKGVWVKVMIGMGGAMDEIWNLIKQGIVKAFSFGFRIPKDGAEFDRATDTFVIKKLDILEVSVVTVPMNGNALFTVDKSGFLKGISIHCSSCSDTPQPLHTSILGEEMKKCNSCTEADEKIDDSTASAINDKSLDTTDDVDDKSVSNDMETDSGIFALCVNAQGVVKSFTSILEKEATLKAGKVLSSKNIKLIETAIADMGKCGAALQGVLDAAAPKATEDDEPKSAPVFDNIVEDKEDVDSTDESKSDDISEEDGLTEPEDSGITESAIELVKLFKDETVSLHEANKRFSQEQRDQADPRQ